MDLMFCKVRQVLPENFVQGYVGLVLEDYASIDHNIAHSQPANKKKIKKTVLSWFTFIEIIFLSMSVKILLYLCSVCLSVCCFVFMFYL